jgi:ribosomal protein L30E
MVTSKITDEEIKTLKTRITEKKMVIGTDCILKGIKKSILTKIYLASNCPIKVKEDISYYARLASIPVIKLELNNEEIGIMCKKNFLVSAIGVK